MIIPMRCFTCGKLISGKWARYKQEDSSVKKEEEGSTKETKKETKKENPSLRYFDPDFKGDILDEIGLEKMCCRRHMLTHVDLVDIL